MVQEAYQIYNKCVEWSINVSRNLNDWEVNEYEELLQILDAQEVKSNSDQVVLKLEKRGEFTLGSYYRYLSGGAYGDLQNFRIKQIWKTKVPPRVVFFAWEACRESILTLDKLRARGRLLLTDAIFV